MKNEINIGIVGAHFMGRAHSNAWFDLGQHYNLPFRVVMKAACDINASSATDFAERLGWESYVPSWEELLQRKDIDVIDICTPNSLHMPITLAAAESGKHIICEKPIAMTAGEAILMRDVARKAGVKHMVAFNYRRVPAIALARNMIREGTLGDIHHFNAVYYQDWLVDPDFPYVWRHDKKLAGSGAHGDMNAHTVDLARFLCGEIVSVSGQEKIFIDERRSDAGSVMKVTADDSMNFLAQFESGAIGNFMATRYATGRKNYLRLEIFGSKGSLGFNLERLNELEYYSRDDRNDLQGFRTIIVTENSHPYLHMWWPPGHIIGWEHTFIHEMGDFLKAIAEDENITPDFHDGYMCQEVLDAVSRSAAEAQWISINYNL